MELSNEWLSCFYKYFALPELKTKKAINSLKKTKAPDELNIYRKGIID